MSALPYMPLYVADYLADTSHLSAIENGAYLLLIMNYWQRGQSLPCGDEQLARICRMSLKEWRGVKTSLSAFFTETDGFWSHDRIENELSKVREKSVKASNAGKVSAQRKLNKQPTPVQQTLNERSTDVEQTFNHTDTDTDTEEKGLSNDNPKKATSEKRGTRLPEDFTPDKSCSDLANSLGFENQEKRDSINSFTDYWRAIPGSKGVKLDWQATLRNWLRNDAKRKGLNHARTRQRPAARSFTDEALAAGGITLDES